MRDIAANLEIPETKLQILHWQDIEDTSYKAMHDTIMTAFEQSPRFRETIIEMVRDVPHFAALALNEPQYTRLAQYILDELPVLIGGFSVGGVHYGLLPYPGLANLDYFALDLQEGTSFPEITKQLNIQEKLRLLELYAE